MNTEQFSEVAAQLLRRCEDTLANKAAEYATEDRLHNFRVASKMQDITMQEALAGMMAKHTISIYDMCRAGAGVATGLWDEKIVDHINYLILLRAIVHETSERTKPGIPINTLDTTTNEAPVVYREHGKNYVAVDPKNIWENK